MFYGHVFCNECFKSHVMTRFQADNPRVHSNSMWMQWGPGACTQIMNNFAGPWTKQLPIITIVRALIGRCGWFWVNPKTPLIKNPPRECMGWRALHTFKNIWHHNGFLSCMQVYPRCFSQDVIWRFHKHATLQKRAIGTLSLDRLWHSIALEHIPLWQVFSFCRVTTSRVWIHPLWTSWYQSFLYLT